MLRAPVPEAAVEEDGDFGTREGDIDRPPREAGDRPMRAVTVAGGVEETAHSDLRSSVAADLATHASGDAC
jgi:hypothetical protein